MAKAKVTLVDYPLVPVYITPVTNTQMFGVSRLNPIYTPDFDTCMKIMDIFDAVAISGFDADGNLDNKTGFDSGIVFDNDGGHIHWPTVTLDAPFKYLTYPTGVEAISDKDIEVLAGQLAMCFTRAPEAKFSDPVYGTLARRNCLKVLGSYVIKS